jgi:hypothetical protein
MGLRLGGSRQQKSMAVFPIVLFLFLNTVDWNRLAGNVPPILNGSFRPAIQFPLQRRRSTLQLQRLAGSTQRLCRSAVPPPLTTQACGSGSGRTGIILPDPVQHLGPADPDPDLRTVPIFYVRMFILKLFLPLISASIFIKMLNKSFCNPIMYI